MRRVTNIGAFNQHDQNNEGGSSESVGRGDRLYARLDVRPKQVGSGHRGLVAEG